MNLDVLNEKNTVGALKNALVVLDKCLPNNDINVAIEIWKFSHREDPVFTLNLSCRTETKGRKFVFAETESAIDITSTVKKLLKQAGITTVEQYIRLNHLDGGAA